MVTPVQRANTVAFQTSNSAANRKRVSSAGLHTDLRLHLSNVLQTSLELQQILLLFFEEVGAHLPLGSLNYHNNKLTSDIEIGEGARHSCHYQLVTSKDSLGELVFTRNKRFSEKELQLLEMLISCLVCPIRNALMYREAVQTALKDPLTGAGNRIALENTLKREVSLSQRHNQPLSLLVIDIDRFKSVNDGYGHTAGDCVLKDVARQLSHCCRTTDATYRFGGEEFVVILNNTETAGALISAERIRSCIEAMTTTYNDKSLNVTVSIGVATLHDDDDEARLFDRADKGLLQAKNTGRNQVINSEERLSDKLLSDEPLSEPSQRMTN
jgi:diguanylate cyclase (GGDEF)-like protein